MLLDPHSPEIQRGALKQGVDQSWLGAAERSPVYEMVMEQEAAFPLHPEYRTLPMAWYISPLSPIQSAIEGGLVDENGIIPSADEIRTPLRYLANLLTAGKIEPIKETLERMIVMRRFKHGQVVHGETLGQSLDDVGLIPEMVEDAYQIMTITNYEDRSVIPTSHKEVMENNFEDKVSCGFSFGSGCSGGSGGLTQESLSNKRKASPIIFFGRRKDIKKNREEGVR